MMHCTGSPSRILVLVAVWNAYVMMVEGNILNPVKCVCVVAQNKVSPIS
jgi:hypothetical protein